MFLPSCVWFYYTITEHLLIYSRKLFANPLQNCVFLGGPFAFDCGVCQCVFGAVVYLFAGHAAACA